MDFWDLWIGFVVYNEVVCVKNKQAAYTQMWKQMHL